MSQKKIYTKYKAPLGSMPSNKNQKQTNNKSVSYERCGRAEEYTVVKQQQQQKIKEVLKWMQLVQESEKQKIFGV